MALNVRFVPIADIAIHACVSVLCTAEDRCHFVFKSLKPRGNTVASSGDQAAAANADLYDCTSRLNITIAAPHNEHTGKRNGLFQLQLAVDAISTTQEAVE